MIVLENDELGVDLVQGIARAPIRAAWKQILTALVLMRTCEPDVLAERVGTSWRQVSRHFRSLEIAGLIDVTRAGQRSRVRIRLEKVETQGNAERPELEREWGYHRDWTRRARIGPFLLVARVDSGCAVRITSQRIAGGLLEEASDLLSTSRFSDVTAAKRRATSFLNGCRIAPAGDFVCHP